MKQQKNRVTRLSDDKSTANVQKDSKRTGNELK